MKWPTCEILALTEEIMWSVDTNLTRSPQGLVYDWKMAGGFFWWYSVTEEINHAAWLSAKLCICEHREENPLYLSLFAD